MSTNKSQSIRRSQYIFTYGPGSIIETINGPRLIPDAIHGMPNYYKSDILKKLEIKDKRLPQYLSQLFNHDKRGEYQYKIYALPTNVSLKLNNNEVVYNTQIFPEWHICYNSEAHSNKECNGKKGENKPILHKGTYCPVCGKPIYENHGTVRFILACPNGHMDDIDWNSEVHKHTKHCGTDYFYWDAAGSSLNSIKIKCPKCGSETNMQEIYGSRPKCKGRLPEKQTADKYPFKGNAYTTEQHIDKNECSSEMMVMQRQSAALRVAETITLLSIPGKSDFEDLLVDCNVKNKITLILEIMKLDGNLNDKEIFVSRFSNSSSGDVSEKAKKDIVKYIEDNGWDKFLNIIDEIYNKKERDITFIDLINEEFNALINHTSFDEIDEDFSMGGGKDIPNSSLFPSFTLFPIHRIRTVTVQTQYRRMVSLKKGDDIVIPKPVNVYTPDPNYKNPTYWFPGFEGYGEGIFLYFKKDAFEKLNHNCDSYLNWMKVKLSDNLIYNNGWNDICTLPEFVWIHTISHSLIKAISEDTGYSAASIRERIYYNRESGEGGILLYNTSPGSDGGMGGLTDLTDSDTIFRDIISKAEDFIRICSNDPLCHNQNNDPKQDGMKVNGSACYSCMFIAETSCEHSNRWLDRDLFLNSEM